MGIIDFGVFISTERPDYQDILNDFLLAEELGYHSGWISDHVIAMYDDPGDNRFECWTTMAALAANTSTIRLGQLVLCNPFRHPPLLAKMASSLDSISQGRLELGLGTGWHEGEFRSYGYSFESPASRVRRLDEAARIIKLMSTEKEPSFKGRFYEINEAYCAPKPVQKPHPPLMIAGGGEQLTLKTVAKYADTSNFAAWRGTPEDFHHKKKVLEKHCLDVDRKCSEIRKSWACFVNIYEDSKSGTRQKGNEKTERINVNSFRAPISGTPSQCISQIQDYVDVGVTLFILRFMGGNYIKEAKLFANEVLPSFKSK